MTGPGEHQALIFPTVHSAASDASRRGRRLFLGATFVELVILAAAAAVVGILATARDGSAATLSGRIVVVLFIAVVLVQRSVAVRRPERAWFGGRVAAESVKTNAWRYSVGGDPFPASLPADECDRLFVARIDRVIESLGELALRPSGIDYQITPSMRDLRTSPLDVRRRVYEDARIADQQAWYSSKAAWNDRRYHLLSTLAFMLELAGVGIGLWLVFGDARSGEAWIGSITTVAAGIAAWSQTRQHSALASAYGLAALELASIRSLVGLARTEEEWARFVDDAEAAISREHTSWKATRLA